MLSHKPFNALFYISELLQAYVQINILRSTDRFLLTVLLWPLTDGTNCSGILDNAWFKSCVYMHFCSLYLMYYGTQFDLKKSTIKFAIRCLHNKPA